MGFAQLYVAESESHSARVNHTLMEQLATVDYAEQPLSELWMERWYLGPLQVAALCSVLATAVDLTTLSFFDAQLTTPGLVAVAALLKAHPALTDVDLRRNTVCATAARELASAAESNPRLIRLAVDSDDAPQRFAKRLRVAVGRNLAARFPVVEMPAEAFVSAQAERCRDPPDCDLVGDDRVVLEAARSQRDSFTRCYELCGHFACQFIADFGAENIAALLGVVTRCFARLGLADGLDTDGVEEHSFRLKRYAIGRLAALRGQRDVWDLQFDTLDRCDTDPATLADILAHLRSSLPSEAPATIAASLEHLAASTDTHQLPVLLTQSRYLTDDFPDMARTALEHSAQCTRPLRTEWATVEYHLVSTLRAPFCTQRRALLRALYLPLPCFSSLVEESLCAAIDTALGLRCVVSCAPSRDWLEVATDWGTDEGRAAWGRHLRTLCAVL